MDIFVGVNNKTGQDLVGIWDAGTGANIFPSTTSVAVPTSQKTYAASSSNYSFDNVDSVINNDTQGNTLNTDLDADGTTDRLLSFSISFADVVSEMSRLASINITDASLLRFVLATSTEQNALNEDLNGVQWRRQ